MTDDQRKTVVAVISTLGFVGNSHYCPDCGARFHDTRGQHEPDCGALADMLEDDEWWDELKRRLP